MEKNSNPVIIGLLVLIVGFGSGYLIRDNQAPLMGNHMMPGGSMMSQNIDQHFIVQMIPHHEGAIEMAKVALERSKRPEMLSLANNIIEAQEGEIKDMQLWYQSWFSSAPAQGGMGMMYMRGMEGDVGTLESVSAAEFDREFIEQMIPHHEMAIMMAQMLQASTERSEMKQLAENIITSQSREIDLMRSWLGAWY